MGVVYLAHGPDARPPVALKLIAGSVASDDEFRARFERECRVAASIDHPHVVPIYHAGQEGRRLYVTMRYITGTDLRALLAEGGGSSRGAPWRSWRRSPTRSTRRTAAASSTAT